MATKRERESVGGASGQPPPKKLMTQLEPVKIGPIYSLEEMDIKVLQFQNKKLAERIEQRRRAEEDLKKRIEQLEQRQSTDDAVLCIVNRYWNQLDEDVRVLLQRFDAEGADELEQKNESAAVTSFLTLLSQWDKQEIEDKLRQRVEFSERAIGKLLQAHDRLLQRREKLWDVIKVKAIHDKDSKNDLKKEDMQGVEEDSKKKIKEEPFEGKVNLEPEDGMGETNAVAERAMPVNITEALREEMDKLMADNKRFENLVTEMHQRHHEITVRNSELQDKLAAAETEAAELKNQVDDLEYQLTNATRCVDKLDRHLADTSAKLKTYQATDTKAVSVAGATNSETLSKSKGDVDTSALSAGMWKNQLNEMATELEDQRELALSRLNELEKLQQDHQKALQEIEKLKMDLSTLPESVIVETTEYKCLQSQFSVLYNESMQIKTQLDDVRSLLTTSKNTHLRQIEQMELDELETQKRLRTEMIQMEDTLSQVRREYDVLRIEFEQMLAANEQTGPINREMRNLISSLKNHNEQLKAEVLRFKRKLRENLVEINKLRDHNQQTNAFMDSSMCFNASSSHPKDLDGAMSSVKDGSEETISRDDDDKDRDDKDHGRGKCESDVIRELRNDLSKCQARERDLKLQLEQYKKAPTEIRDKAQLMSAEKRFRTEVDDLRQQVQSLRGGGSDADRRKIRRLEETVAELQKNLAAQKQEEEAMLSEMEVTGQAFEDMQEQNVRLLQQLREKDDANFKLMSERIKSNQLLKLLREEKDIIAEQVATYQHQVESQNLVVRKLEEKERVLLSNLSTIEKELQLRQQAQEMYKRKAVESAQTAADLKLHLDKYHAQLKEAQIAVAEKTGATQQQGFKFKRIQEDLATLRKKLDRAKKIEMASSADEVLMEEIREYKEQLTCPSCKVKKKDAVLTKCFHVFCLECLKTRYETRQRKCPKCNATFGANDYHRIYLE